MTEDGNTDRVKGVVHNNSLARLLMTRGPGASIEPAVKDALIVPETSRSTTCSPTFSASASRWLS